MSDYIDSDDRPRVEVTVTFSRTVMDENEAAAVRGEMADEIFELARSMGMNAAIHIEPTVLP